MVLNSLRHVKTLSECLVNIKKTNAIFYADTDLVNTLDGDTSHYQCSYT